MARLRGVLVAMTFVISARATLAAQESPVKTLPRHMKSCGPLAVILVSVVDARGTMVTDARLDVKRERDGTVLPGRMADSSPMGGYVVMDDMALPLVPAGGARFIVHARRGREAGTAVLRIGRTPDRCHVRLLDGAATLVVRR